jgi:hypothetical protein
MRKNKIIDKETGKLRKRFFNEHGGCPYPKGSQEAKKFFNFNANTLAHKIKYNL